VVPVHDSQGAAVRWLEMAHIQVSRRAALEGGCTLGQGLQSRSGRAQAEVDTEGMRWVEGTAVVGHNREGRAMERVHETKPVADTAGKALGDTGQGRGPAQIPNEADTLVGQVDHS
jgi:hypothetical protein